MTNKVSKSCRHVALDVLAIRDHSALELQRKLLTKGFSAEEVERTVSALAANNLQSDTRFTEHFVASRCRNGYGPQRVAMELRQRGVAESLIDQWVWQPRAQWQQALEKLVAKRFGQTPAQSPAERVKRQRYLMQRGFEADAIREIT